MRVTSPDQLAHTLRCGRKARGWRLWTLAVATLCFVLLVSAAASHHHTTAAAAHECPLCTAVADKLADNPAPPQLAVAKAVSVSYHLERVAIQVAAYPSPTLLPPSCGPPALI